MVRQCFGHSSRNPCAKMSGISGVRVSNRGLLVLTMLTLWSRLVPFVRRPIVWSWIFFGRFKSVTKLAFSMPKVQPHPVTFLLSLTGFIRNHQRSQLACRTPSAAPGRCCSRRNPAEHLWLLETAEKWCATNQRTKVVLYVVFGWVNTVPYLGQWTWVSLGYFVVHLGTKVSN